MALNMANNTLIEEKLRSGEIALETAELIKEYNNRLQQNNVPIIYNLKHLREILKISLKNQDKYFGKNRNEYHSFELPKKSGGVRVIEAPSDTLKKYQLWIKESILDKFKVSDYAKGFKKNCSILDNAKCHVGQELVINIDLKDFFPSIKYSQVFKIFAYIGYTNEVAHLLTRLCTNNHNVLPQGSPASPVISNIVSLKLDKRLSALATSFGCTYSRYADDITFSGNNYIKNIFPIVERIIIEEGFSINVNKIRLQYSYQRQEVTGLIVNKKVNVAHEIENEIKNAIYFCKKYGVDDHLKTIKCTRSFYKEHLYGIAYFIKMIDADKGRKYLEELDTITWAY